MATTKSFAEVLATVPMEDAAMTDNFEESVTRGLQQIEQVDPDFFNSEQDARSRASSQYSSRSRGGLAPQTGVQARLDLFPTRVARWNRFFDDVEWDSFEQEAGFGDVQVREDHFDTNFMRISNLNEQAAVDRFKVGMNDPVLRRVVSFRATASPNGWTPFDVQADVEMTGVGHRVDLVWTRQRPTAGVRASAGLAATSVANRARFLVHEHKSPGKFPYGLADAELTNLARNWAQGSHNSLDDAKNAVNEAWEGACDDLVDYWEMGEGFRTREGSVRFRYPIIQIYVYMLRSFCKYGVLSTTDRTWFFKIDQENVLHISRVFRSTGTGRDSMRYAYTCMLYRAVVGMARLELDEEHLRAICQTDIRRGSPEWNEVWRRFGYGDGAGVTTRNARRGAALPDDRTDAASLGDKEALRELLPLKSDLHFPYAGGLLDVIKQYPEGQYGFAIRVDTGGVDTVVKVMTPAKAPEETAKAESAFWHEMDVYRELRSLWGTHVPWYLYGGRHIFNDLIVATSYAGESLNSSAVSEDVREKAWAALTEVHNAGVAHGDVLLRNFVMDDAGTVRIIDFAQAKTGASIRDFQRDRDDFDRVFSGAQTRCRRKT
ncbi:Hypothetical Protein FCC1311_066552 [Hondaea fermentalgiana]|uniref:Protein kinase domain-containing protein n=1 Tax=Hondaea fermentalgiana TaxID=2315210 RepID=A0A2R5GHR7_9STRA|nr:Hypothetical Protein FCC1311_066552 [Hondaea fermentalgiana]|eukprot:GBG30436.1 Hypothetical Protein FCC1311_066552 [Hondaea fermentalgiana]